MLPELLSQQEPFLGLSHRILFLHEAGHVVDRREVIGADDQGLFVAVDGELVGFLFDVLLGFDHPFYVGFGLEFLDEQLVAVHAEAEQLLVEVLGVQLGVVEQLFYFLGEAGCGDWDRGLAGFALGLACWGVVMGRLFGVGDR